MTDAELTLRALAYWSLLPLLGVPIHIIASRRGSTYFKNRMMVWMVVVPVFLGAFYLGSRALVALLALGCLGGAWELARLNHDLPPGSFPRAAAYALLSLPWIALAHLGMGPWSWLALAALALPLVGLRRFADSPPRWLPAAAALSLGAGLYFWVVIAYGDQGIRWLLLAFTAVTVNDMLAAVFGKFIKSTQPFPSLSPHKSLAGYLGGALCGLAAGFALRPGFPDISTGVFTLVILAVVAAGNAGDLFASWLKRGYGLKDFGWILGDMGGVLDRLDSLLPAGAVLFIILSLL